MQTAHSSMYGDCLFCGTPLRHTFVDLGMSPLCESYVSPAHLNSMEPFYPLHVFVCEKCLSGAASGIREPCRHLFRIRIFFLVLRQLGGACAPVHRTHGGALQVECEEPRRGTRQQRRVPAAALRETRHPRSGHRTCSQCRARRRRAQRPDARGVLR